MRQQRTTANDPNISEENQHDLAQGDLKQTAHELAAGVLNQVAQDLRRFHGTTSRAGRAHYFDAYRWLTANELSWPFSFLNICRALSLTPESVRAELMSDLALGRCSALDAPTKLCHHL